MAEKLRAFPNAVDLDFVVNAFESSLIDPHKPMYCAQCLMGCLLCLSHPSVSTHNYPVLRVARPAFSTHVRDSLLSLVQTRRTRSWRKT